MVSALTELYDLHTMPLSWSCPAVMHYRAACTCVCCQQPGSNVAAWAVTSAALLCADGRHSGNCGHMSRSGGVCGWLRCTPRGVCSCWIHC